MGPAGQAGWQIAARPVAGYALAMKEVTIYTDGSCLGNPGPGGWAAVLATPDGAARLEISGGFRRTTNNRMEIMAVIQSLERLRGACRVRLFTDSRYVRNAVEKRWLASWQARGWRKADRKPVLNTDLWRRLMPLLESHEIRFHWLRGHAGHAENERCDFLARTAAAGQNLPPDEVFENGAE